MYVQVGSTSRGGSIGDRAGTSDAAVARLGVLGALVAFERIGSRRSLDRNAELFAEGDAADCWFRVISGAVRLSKLLANGRRHITEFYFAGDCFGIDNLPERLFSAEAVGEVVVMRYPRRATERLIDEQPQLARSLRDMMVCDLANAQMRMLLLGRMSAPERVATFLLDMFDRRDARRSLDLPMSRSDIADYLGLTIETVCRVLSAFKRDGLIDIANPHQIELRDRGGLAAIGEA
ncbi:MAG TPA: helix-turn-helix domain-containing protein [Stellaceae bacterium]|nr:helix-turn-helix domain-containing protein [Stellaceae bacterium]